MNKILVIINDLLITKKLSLCAWHRLPENKYVQSCKNCLCHGQTVFVTNIQKEIVKRLSMNNSLKLLQMMYCLRISHTHCWPRVTRCSVCRSQVSRPSNRTGSPQTNRFWCIITVGNSFFCSAAVCTRDSKQGQTTGLWKSSACNKNTRITTIYKNSFCLQVQTPISTKPGTCKIEIRYQSPCKKERLDCIERRTKVDKSSLDFVSRCLYNGFKTN